MNGAELITGERERQIADRGYSADHDSRHHDGELAAAAAAYALPLRLRNTMPLARDLHEIIWPPGWDFRSRADSRIRDLVKAGALCAAEIDRLLAQATEGGDG